MEQGFNFGNVIRNMTKQQKLAGLLFVTIIIVLLVVLGVLLSGLPSGGFNENGEWVDGNSDNGEKVTVTEEKVNIDGQDYVVKKETTTNGDGVVVESETKTDYYGNVTTTDPNLITTYFPYQTVRNHEGSDPTLRYFLSLNESSKTIDAIIEDCDVEGDKSLVQQYIDSVPLDLSMYTINYVVVGEDISCK